MRPLTPVVAVAALLVASSAGPADAPAKPRGSVAGEKALTQGDWARQAAERLLGAALASDRAYEDLVHLCDRIGHRLAGSAALDRAIAWALERMGQDGLVRVGAEEVVVPTWVRGAERATLLTPVERPLPVLGLGGTVATPDGGVTADVLVVSDFDELEARSSEARGRIVLFDAPFTEYGETVAYRVRGASAAARHGAVAALVRSITPSSLSTPHTGMMRYDEDTPRIPVAALAIEDAATLHRLAARGVTPKVRLELGARELPDGRSANVVGEVRGREKPEEVVVVGCHLDSWDVGQGAQDDGAGCVMAMAAGRLLAALDRPPRRTVRVVLYTNEENGLRGARAYAERHRDQVPRHVAAIEADTGAGWPSGFRVDVRGGSDEAASRALGARALAHLAPLGELLEPLAAGALRLDFAGADVGALAEAGVPCLGLDQDLSGYWPIHHTAADTVDKVDPRALATNVAAVTLAAFWLAENPEPPPRAPPAPANVAGP